MTDSTARLFADIFRAQGALDADRLGRLAADALDQDRRDARIYELRAEFTETQISLRFGLTVRRVQQIVREQTRLRRELLRETA